MPSFRLSKDTMDRLQAKFDEFIQARKLVHENIVNYVADYRSFDGDKQDRREFLEREYMPLAPQMSHLILDDKQNILWHVQDIAIIMGRDNTAITKLFSRMEGNSGWSSKLLALQEEARSANNNLIHVYHEGIFDLIFDKYEDEYLGRFTKPRQGKPPVNPDEVIRFWKYLKTQNAHDELFNFDDDEEVIELPDIPAMSWHDIFALIIRKAFTAKNLTLFPIVFAISFELARRWKLLIPIFAAMSLIIFLSCLVMLRTRKAKPGILADVGAVAIMCAILWGLGLISDGVIYSPAGNMIDISNNDHKIKLVPALERNHKIVFRINSNFYDDISEIYYRLDKTGDYILTGFNDYEYPLLFIEPKKQSGNLMLEIKYKDSNGKEHGPFEFEYDLDETRYKLSKEKQKKPEMVIFIEDKLRYMET
ncbi:MAG: hypothetical protein IJR63_01640 [Synergistaceae bacterium]|nr:hypothetical protein [Synergistaceae bacterium]